MFEKFSANYFINTAFVQPIESDIAVVSRDQYNKITEIYKDSSRQPFIKIPSEKTHFAIEVDTTLPSQTIQYPQQKGCFNAKQREYLLATPKSPVHSLFSI